MEEHPDLIGGPSTTELAGTRLEYTYTTGRSYRVDFSDEGVYFTMIDPKSGEIVLQFGPDGPSETLGPLPYRARKIRDDLFFVGWLVRPPSVHVALLVDFEKSQIHVSAMMPPGKWEYFDVGDFISVDRNHH